MAPETQRPSRPSTEPDLREATGRLLAEERVLLEAGGAQAIAREHGQGGMTARERIAALLDRDEPLLELGLWAGYQLYEEWGGAPAAGVITGIGRVSGRRAM